MDYVVAGFGIGAILALIGFALWELFGNVEEPGAGWPSRAAIGLMLGALVIWAVTGVSLVSNIEDSMGSRLVTLTTLVALVAIAGGTFWYWRAERALAASRPRPAKMPAQLVAAAPATASVEDLELTDWDSWPEREAGKLSDESEAPPTPEPPVDFEAEVAVAAADTIADEPDSPGTEAVAVAETAHEAEAGEPVETGSNHADPESALPANVRSFPAPALVDPSEPVLEEDVLLTETMDTKVAEIAEVVEVVEEGAEAEGPAIVVEDIAPKVDADIDEPDSPPTAELEPNPAVANGSVAPESFESSLLADIDGSLVDEDGGYRSPLLSDLGSDQLKGVGLAKWRPEARLTEPSQDDKLPPPKSSKRR